MNRNDQADGVPGKYTSAVAKPQVSMPPEPEAGASEEERAEGRCFGYLLGHRQSVMLELRLLNGDRRGLCYSYLPAVEYTGGCITLHFTEHKVKVEGSNLLPIFSRLVLHRVSYIQVIDSMNAAAMGPDDPVVEAITVEKPKAAT